MFKSKFIKVVAFVCFATAILFPSISNAQKSDLGNWLVYVGNKKLNDKWNLHHEVQYRNYNALGDLEQLLLRTGLGYTFGEKKYNVLLGYGYIFSENYLFNTDEKVSVNEHRIFQQFVSKQKVGKVALNHRYRFEQRFVESQFKMRFRYLLGLGIPLTQKEKNNYYVSMYNEIFLNTASSVFDRNRVYAGVGCKLNDKTKLEVGYLNQLFEKSSRDQLAVALFVNF